MSAQQTNSYDFFPSASVNVPTGITVLNAYNSYFINPVQGANVNVALYSDNLSLGYKGYNPPANGAIISGNVAIAQTSAVAPLDVLGIVRKTGNCDVAEIVTSASALSTSQDSIIDSRTSGAITVTLANGTLVDQVKRVRLYCRNSPAVLVALSRGNFNLTASEASRTLRYTVDGWVVSDIDSASTPSSYYTDNQTASILTATGVAASSQMGNAVALSADGLTLALGAPTDATNVGAVFIFTRAASTSTWTQQGAKLVGTVVSGPGKQGSAVALSADGNTLAVGAPADNTNAGSVVIWTRNTSSNTWTQQGSALVGAGATGAAKQGTSVTLSADGNTLALGGPANNTNVGAIWFFTRSAGVWSAQGSAPTVPTGNTGAAQLGTSVQLSADGNTLALGGPKDNTNVGGAWVWLRTGTTWAQQSGPLVGSGGTTAQQGNSVSLSADGNTLAVGGSQDNTAVGAVWIWNRVNVSTWTQQGAKLIGTGAGGSAAQGSAVALSDDGFSLAVGGSADTTGGSNCGATWVWYKTSGTYLQQGSKLTGSGAAASQFQGAALAMNSNGSVLVVGGYGYSSSQGAAWQFG